MSSTELFSDLAEYMQEIEEQMKSVVERRGQVAPLFRSMVFHHFGWSSSEDQRLQARGKRIRPLITILVGNALGGKRDALVSAAVGLELLHNFTIVHDDIMDGSLERRHRPTVWSIWGAGQAINAGDGLFALGYLSALDLRGQVVGSSGQVGLQVIAAMTEACLATAEGQILDMSFEKRYDVSVEEYVVMVSNKSAALIACASLCGALISTENEAIAKAYTEFGRNLGIAFQIRDDFLGIWGSPDVTGKPSGIDILERKKSLPVIWGLNQSSASARQRLLEIYEKDNLDALDIAQVQAILTEVGADIHTDQMATSYYEQSLNALSATGVENEWQAKLRTLARFLVERRY